MRFALLVRVALAFFVAAVVLPVPVYGGFILFRAFEDGPQYDSQTLIAAFVLIVGVSVVLIAARSAQDRLVRATRPLEPVYDDAIPTDAVRLPRGQRTSIREEVRSAREGQNKG
ncbi:hypothetical protein [Curtobacterium flaccumfaciens]|uniref:hypothetical protein n=1 Tax=Curtobacterium flaccumfaciens TaxID=2035 RepID=UPI001266B6E5|nr:hypothetical protein [Curtobacterium flaccumfaciens]MBT1667318.1 hypothetical protein [Curtobacterium flaccumfaciens pv. flaccumfaciens]QFS79482.1 hypothetical protein GBG65_08530 [Curtobacterium flaccumfaciens pv. flaccumfaciens]